MIIGYSCLLMFIVFQKSVVLTVEIQQNPKKYDILNNLKSLPSSLMEIEEVPLPRLENLKRFMFRSFRTDNLLFKFLSMADLINQYYEEFNYIKNSSDNEETWLTKMYDFANTATDYWTQSLWDHLNDFKDAIFSESVDEGMFDRYVRYVNNMIQKNKWCEEGESFNHFIYSSFKFSLNIFKKGFHVMLQSYIIRNAFEGRSRESIYWFKEAYKSIIKSMIGKFKRLASHTSTRIASCDPVHEVRNETYLEMEKLLQGILPPEVTLNSQNSAKGTCENYSGIKYYPYEGVRYDGDWRCHGLMYNCFRISNTIDICKPSIPNRRMDGYIEKFDNWQILVREYSPVGRGHLRQCFSNNLWEISDWRYSLPSTWYNSEQCACICDDFDHPKTLRRFSREYAVSDYKNNMVVTGIRLVNISNVIHIQIQEGKLGKFGIINSSTVQWRLKNDIVNNVKNPHEAVTLSYHKRRVNLDALYSSPNEVILGEYYSGSLMARVETLVADLLSSGVPSGAAFDWDQEEKAVTLSIFVSVFSFETGELDRRYRQHSASVEHREEIVLQTSRIPTMCPGNIRKEGNNKFVKFQTTDWRTDAAQTTIPYLDIQEVVTNPPAMLRGIGLYYKSISDCGGYIGLELYSHEFEILTMNDDTF